MPTFRINHEGRFVEFEPKKAEELEAQIEGWLEDNPHVLLSPERVLYVGRQVTTDLQRAIDLLAVDSRGRLVVVELKKDRTPRDMVAQALEYAAFVRRLDYDALNTIATSYFKTRGEGWESLSEAHQRFFSGPEVGPEPQDMAWNSSQIVVLVGQTIQPEIIDVSRYLRDHNIDVRVLQFAYLESSSGERLVNVQTVVGSQQLPREASRTATQPMPSREEVLARVPKVKPLFEKLSKAFASAGLHLRAERTQLSFDLTQQGQPILNMWPSSAGRIILMVLGHRASELGDLDRFQLAVEELGLFTRRGAADLSIHLYPPDKDNVDTLVSLFRQHFPIAYTAS